jgi:hypothetical protein
VNHAHKPNAHYADSEHLRKSLKFMSVVVLDGFPCLSVLPLLDTILCAILCAEGAGQGCFNGPSAATVGDYHIPNEADSTEGMNSMSGERNRCPLAKSDLYVQYHDTKWGVPVHDDRLLFEFLILEGAQAGLSWETILKKRQNYREAFNNLDPIIVAEYGQKKRTSLLSNAGIVCKPQPLPEHEQEVEQDRRDFFEK